MMTSTQKEQPLQQVISDLFHDFKGDETGGQHAMRGFNFQVWYAVLEALRAYRSGEDYAVVLEWQQDVAVLDSSTSPTEVRFVQLKKNETATHWKLHNISDSQEVKTKPPTTGNLEEDALEPNWKQQSESKSSKTTKKQKDKVQKPSFLAKLYQHRRRFSGLKRARLEFVSNAKYEIPDELGKTSMETSCELESLDESVKKQLEAKIRGQLCIPIDEIIDISDFGLLVSDCPIHEPYKYVAGELAEMQIGSDLKLGGAETLLAVLVIASYIQQRSGLTRFAKDLPELLQRGVTRSDIDKYLIAANSTRESTESLVGKIITRLNLENASFTLVRKMDKELTRVCVEITNRASSIPLVAAHLKLLYELNAEYECIPRLSEILSAWYDDFQKLNLPDAHVYTREYLYCLMSMIIQNAHPVQQLPSVSSGSQSKDKE